MNPMNNNAIANSASTASAVRCHHRTVSGKRCRLTTLDSSSRFCLRHSAKHLESVHASNLRSILAGELTQFECAYDVNKFLSNLLLLLSEDRVSPRRGSVMAYTCNLILRTIAFRTQELQAHSDDDSAAITIDFGNLPRPDRSQPTRIPSDATKPS